MKIVVIGETGLVELKVIERLLEQGHEVLTASQSTGVDTITGAGLADALRGAAVVIDASRAPSFPEQDALAFFEISTRQLLTSEATAGVQHHVAIAVFDSGRATDKGYCTAKVEQEALIKISRVPYSIVHAGRVFEGLDDAAGTVPKSASLQLSPALARPIAADDFARVVCGIAVGAPLNTVVEVAGPEVLRHGNEQWASAARTVASEDMRLSRHAPQMSRDDETAEIHRLRSPTLRT